MAVCRCLLMLLLVFLMMNGRRASSSSSSSRASGSDVITGSANADFMEEYHHHHHHNENDDSDNKLGACVSSSSSGHDYSDYVPLPDEDVADSMRIGGPKAHLYGEMTARGFRSFASYCNLTRDDVFLDLGSGVGSLVIQAATEFGVQQSIGVELSPTRHGAAMSALEKMTSSTGTHDAVGDTVTFVQGDAASEKLVGDFLANDATVVWISNLLFDDELQRRLASVIEQHAGPNLRVIASLKALPKTMRNSSAIRSQHEEQQQETDDDDDDDFIQGFELQSTKVPFEMSWTAGIRNQHYSYDYEHEQQQQPQQTSPSSPSSSPGHYCSILLRRRKKQ